MHRYELRAWLTAIMANILLINGHSIAGYIWTGFTIIWIAAYVFKEETD